MLPTRQLHPASAKVGLGNPAGAGMLLRVGWHAEPGSGQVRAYRQIASRLEGYCEAGCWQSTQFPCNYF